MPETPVEPENTVTLKGIQWHCNFWKDAAAKAETIAYLKEQSFDLVSLTHLPKSVIETDHGTVEEFAKACGYSCYTYVVADDDVTPDATKYPVGVIHVLLSKYELTEKDPVWDLNPEDTTEDRAFGYAVANINGTNLDVFYGESAGNSAVGFAQIDTVGEKIAALNSENDFIVLGYRFNEVSEYAGVAVTQSVGGGHSVLASTGIVLSNGKTIPKTDVGTAANALARMSTPQYAELSVPYAP